MTRAGEKLYRDEDEPRGSVVWALITHPQTRGGFRDTARVMMLVLVGMWFLGVG
jgi:hypothetical protein